VLWGVGSPSLVNNIVYANHGVGVYVQFEHALVSYGDIFDNDSDWAGALADPTGTDGNLAAPPTFATASDDGDWTNDDFTLRTTSSLVDAGDPSLTDSDGSRSDMGAFGGTFGSW